MAKRNSSKKTAGNTYYSDGRRKGVKINHATEASKTAQHANPRHSKPNKQEKRLQARIADFTKGSQAQKQDKQGSRWDAGGYHVPGSLQ